MNYGKPTPRENPWGDAYAQSADAGVSLTTCEHCDTRTWVLEMYIDARIPKRECANCGCVWEGEQIIEPSELGDK